MRILARIETAKPPDLKEINWIAASIRRIGARIDAGVRHEISWPLPRTIVKPYVSAELQIYTPCRKFNWGGGRQAPAVPCPGNPLEAIWRRLLYSRIPASGLACVAAETMILRISLREVAGGDEIWGILWRRFGGAYGIRKILWRRFGGDLEALGGDLEAIWRRRCLR